MTDLCTICARSGSKGIIGKNLHPIAGKPLIAHSIDQAKQSHLFDLIAVSSDDIRILKIAEEYGADIAVVRPDHLAMDSSPKVPAIRHCVEEVERQLNQKVSRVIDLDATSPLRVPDDIKEVFNLLVDPSVGNVITGTPSRRSPYFNMVQFRSDGTPELVKKNEHTYTRRQDTPVCYDMNASIYGWQRDVLAQTDSLFNESTRLFVMPEERSIDIDSPLDLEIVSFLLEKQIKNEK